MKRTVVVGSTMLLLALSSSATGFGVRLDDCSALPPQVGLLEAHPELGPACEAVIEHDGQRWLSMHAELRYLRDDLLVLRFKGTGREVALTPGAAEPIVATGGDGGLPESVAVGSPLKVYIPEASALEVFAAPDGRSSTLVPVAVEPAEPLEQRIATYTCCPRQVPWYPIPEFLPMTAGPLPMLGLLGVALLAAGAALRHRRLSRG